MHSRPPSADTNTSGAPDRDGAYNVRSVPVRVHLPDGPVLQELVPPILEDGMSPNALRSHHVTKQTLGLPNTLNHFLSTLLPLLFPPSASEPPFQDLAYALIQGVVAPKEAEMAWLGACMAGADGWVNVCVGILRESS